MLKFRLFILLFLLSFALAIVQKNIAFLIAVVAIFVLILFVGVSFIRLQFFTKSFCKKQTKQKVIALTFDDGPCGQTEKIIEILHKYNAKATFFCIGEKLLTHKKLITKMSDSGYEIANHSYSHSNFFPLKKIKKIKAEIEKTNAEIEHITGKKNKLFRPPFGVTNPNIARATRLTGMNVIGWSIRSYDTSAKSDRRLNKRIIRQIKEGKIILLHDTSSKIINTLENILEYLRKENYQTLTVSQLMELK